MNWLIGIYELTDEQMELAKRNNLNKKTVISRIHSGQTADQAVSKPARKWQKWDKKDFEEAKANGISEEAFRKRRGYGGYTLEEAKTLPKNTRRDYMKKKEDLPKEEKPKQRKRTLVRGRTEKQVLKQTEMLKKRGWVPIMDKPKLDPANPYAAETDSYVMVLEAAKCKHI